MLCQRSVIYRWCKIAAPIHLKLCKYHKKLNSMLIVRDHVIFCRASRWPDKKISSKKSRPMKQKRKKT